MRLNTEQCDRILKSVDISETLKIIVLNNYGLNELSEDEYNNNLYCVDDDNIVVWQVDSPNYKYGSDAYTYVKITDGNIVAKRESGKKFVVDEKTGVAIEIGFEK